MNFQRKRCNQNYVQTIWQEPYIEIHLLCIGKVKESFYRSLIETRKNEIGKRCVFSICQLPDLPITKNAGKKEEEKIKIAEGEVLLRHIAADAYVIALCIEGKELNSPAHVQLMKSTLQSGYHNITYVIGGSLGLSDAVTQRADYKLSFSKMTFPHQLMRVMLIEELANAVRYL